MEKVKDYIQDVEVHITVGARLSMSNAEKYHIPVPSLVPDNMIVALRPKKNSIDSYWIAKITSTKTEKPLVYNVRYYDYNKQRKCWVLMKGGSAYGTVDHGGILAAGIEFNKNNTITENSKRLIIKSVQND